jgi:hypothetical protein
MSDKTGGPAFPRIGTIEGGVGEYGQDFAVKSTPGITIRDYFAAAALTGLLPDWGTPTHSSSQAAIAGLAYGIADAMLRERER